MFEPAALAAYSIRRGHRMATTVRIHPAYHQLMAERCRPACIARHGTHLTVRLAPAPGRKCGAGGALFYMAAQVESRASAARSP